MEAADKLQVFRDQIVKILDPKIRKILCQEIAVLPDAVFSNRGGYYHHPKPVRGDKGLLIHIFYTLNALEVLMESFENPLSQQDKDLARAALILHDSHKYGPNGDTTKIQLDHPKSYADYLLGKALDLKARDQEEESSIYEKLSELIRYHHGKWSNPKYEGGHDIVLSLVHYSDYIASALDTIEDISKDLPDYLPRLK
jgi:hypothetical protein